MPKRIALLRAVNVAGQGKIKMAELKAALAAEGFQDVQTLLASGNLVFEAQDKDDGPRIEASLKRDFGLETDVLIRDLPEWSQTIAANPFGAAAADRPNHLILTSLTEAPSQEVFEAFVAEEEGPEKIALIGRHVLVDYAGGVATSKLTLSKIEKRLSTSENKLRGTGRNWNSVLKLKTMLES